MRRKDRIELEKKLTPTENCNKKRKVTSCEECCRYEYCSGYKKHPYSDKLIDLWLNVKRI